MLFNNKFILASSSLSRYKILKNVNLDFIKIKPFCDEEKLKKKLIKMKKKPKQISLELARLKSKSVSLKNTNQLVVGCDTVICLNDNSMMSKAKNKKEAKQKIIKMMGGAQTVYSSASVFYNGIELWSSTQRTKVKVRKLKEYEINQYLKRAGRQILSSVGCFQIERLGPNIIENISGDFFNVMGFPLFPFLEFLKKHKMSKT